MRLGEATNEKDLLRALNETVERRKELRRPWDTLWWNNIALIAGDHYTRWDPLVGEFIRQPKEDHEVRLVLNHALTVGRTELSKLTKAKPIMDVVAQSEETEDISAAKVGKKVLEGFEWKFALRRQRKTAFWWMIVTGLGAVYVGWDPANQRDGKYEYYIDPTTNEPTWNDKRISELKQMIDAGTLRDSLARAEEPLGDLEYRHYSPFQLLPDEMALEWDEIKDLITVDVVDVDIARENWDNKDIQPEEGVTPATIDQVVMLRSGLLGSQTGPQPAKNAVAIYSWWLEPGVYGGKYLENGKLMRWCNKNLKLEETSEFPYSDCRLPFAFFEHIPNATSIWPDSVMGHIRGVNLEMDKTASQLIENKDYMANPMWMVPLQCDLPRDIVSIPGAVIRYRHVPNVPEPHPVEGVPMPPQVENLLAGLRSQILDISGQGEVSRGNLPSGARSGVQVAYLQEEDETRLGPTAENIEDGIARMSSLTLSRVSQFYHTNRMVRIYRRDGQFDILKFKGADLKNNTDVVVLAGSALPKSKAARQQYVLELVQMGVERDPKRIRDMLELGMGEPDDTDKAYAQANRENHAMIQGVLIGGDSVSKYYGVADPTSVGGEPGAGQVGAPQAPPEAGAGDIAAPQITTKSPGIIQSPVGDTRTTFDISPTDGQPPPGTEVGFGGLQPEATGEHAPSELGKKGPQAIPVKAWHNHTAHLERHYSFMMDEEYEKLAETRPEIVRLFDEHTGMHEQQLSAQRQQQLQELQAMKGAPGQKGDGNIAPQPTGKSDALLQNEADLRQNATPTK